MRTSTGTAGGRLTAAALAVLLLGACGRPAPADGAQSATAPDPAAQATTPTSATVNAEVPTNDADEAADEPRTDAEPGEAATATVVTAPRLTADSVIGVVDPTPGMAGVKITSQNPIVAPTPTTTPPTVADTVPGGTGGVHVVQPGDTLSGIAETYGVPIQAIADANGLVDVDNLKQGQELQIPPAG